MVETLTVISALALALIGIIGAYIFFKADVERLHCSSCGEPLKSSGHAVFDLDNCAIVCDECWGVKK